MYQNLFDFLQKLHPISSEATNALENLCSVVSIKKNKDLQPIGFTCKTIYFIKKGVARIYYYKNNNDITECFAFEDCVIARVESLFTGLPSKKAIQALEDTDFIAIQAVPLFRLYDQYPEIERLFRKVFELSHIDTINRMESIQFHSAEERYNDLVKKAPEIVQRIPLKHIASYLGITQVSLSRIRSYK